MLRIDGSNLGPISRNYNCDKAHIICQGLKLKCVSILIAAFLIYVDLI